MAKKLPPIKPVGTVSVIRRKGATVKDPVRFPRVIDPMENGVKGSYVDMMNSMAKMVQVELLKQVKN